MRHGVDHNVLANVMNTSSARCWSSDTYNPVPGVLENVPSSRDYEGGFSCSLLAKDLGLAEQAAASVKASIPMGGASKQLFDHLCKMGYVSMRMYTGTAIHMIDDMTTIAQLKTPHSMRLFC